MRPLIGIFAYNDLAQWRDWSAPAALIPQTYVDAVRRSNGRPVLLPPGGDSAEAAATVADLDGLILAGGGGVGPSPGGADPGGGRCRGPGPVRSGPTPEDRGPQPRAGRLGAGPAGRGAGPRRAVAGHLPGLPPAPGDPGRHLSPPPA